MRDLPRKLTSDELAILFEGRTNFTRRLAEHENPLAVARRLLTEIPEDELIDALNAHPRIGGRPASIRSAREQGAEEDSAILSGLAKLNQTYEDRFGFRFVVFVNRRRRSEILRVLQQRLNRTREQELLTAIDDLVSIAEDRYRSGALKGNGGRR
ncbi:MAG TPA: 2-oxo-4-hydroxy-4-carboxy-5-ureidoimidazoline decarboxylase [bacterium]|nr:2-oxo-4-hydroxy-4-carboxy-5-ureidoimidazoline decarboxylase [bacterium]